MLQNIRDNSQGWIAKTIIGVIVVLLALTGFDAIFNATSNRQNAADVNGEKITINELSQAVDMQRRQLLQQLGKDFDASQLNDNLLREAALKGLIERRLLLQGAKDADFARMVREFSEDGGTVYSAISNARQVMKDVINGSRSYIATTGYPWVLARNGNELIVLSSPESFSPSMTTNKVIVERVPL